MSFFSKFNRFRKKVRAREIRLKQELGLEAFTFLAEASPVDTGALRLSTRIGLGEPDYTFLPPLNPKSGLVTGEPLTGSEEGYARGVLSDVQFGQKVILSNRVPYAVHVIPSNVLTLQGIYDVATQKLAADVAGALNTAKRANP